MKAAWWWIDRWRTSSAYGSMTAEERGVYREFLDELWLRDGLLPLDEMHLARVAGGESVFARVKDKVLAHFVKTPEGWRNETHDAVQADSRKRAEKQARYRNKHRNVTASPSPSPSIRKPGDVGNVAGNVTTYTEPPMPNPTPIPAWEPEAMESWSRHLGGENVYIFADLAPVVRRYGARDILDAWERYCAAQAEIEGGKFASARAFAQKPGPWLKKPEPERRHKTAAELTKQALEELAAQQ